MSNKKFPKLAVLSLLGILALTGCGSSDEDNSVKALPGNYNNPIVYVTEGDELSKVQNNINSIIADQLQKGDLPSKTLDKVLYRYAQSIFGSYNKITSADLDDSITLKAATKDLQSNSATHEVADEFIRSHKVYWTYNEKGEHVDDQGKKVEDDANFAPSASEYTRVTSRFANVEKRIAENMFSKAKSGGYTTKHFFKEVDYLKSLYQAGQDVIHYKQAEALVIPGSDVPYVRPLIIDYTVEGEDVFEEEILHREFYQTNYEVTADETQGDAQHHYVEKVIVPEVYNDLLVEQYLLDEQSNAVKQSRARLINVIKIEKYNGFHINADLLVKQLVKEIYSNLPTGNTLKNVDEENNPYEEIFQKYEDISKGLTVIDTDAIGFIRITDESDPHYWDAAQIIARIHDSRSDAFKCVTSDQGINYYENTNFGDLVEDYEEYLSAESFDEIDTSLRDKFTSNGTIAPEEGFDQEKISLSQVETITKGWYVQKSAPSLDSNGEIKKNLFQLSVANNKMEAHNDEEITELLVDTDRIFKAPGAATWSIRPEKADGENKYICSINGSYFLKFEGSYAGSDYINDIVYDDGSAYYVCQVIEAVKDVKLRNSESVNSYANTRGQEFLNKVISEVTTKVAETGSYSSLSKEYWLEKMNLVYHDQNVYDYFKTNYPDLFEDED